MSWTHSSKGVILGVLLAVSVMAVGTAAALSVSADVPEQTKVNTTVDKVTIVVEQPFDGQPDQWTLKGTTELENATWTVKAYKQGRFVSSTQDSGNLTYDLNFDSDQSPTKLVINVTGTVPEISEFSYRNMSVENYTVARLSNQGTGNTIQTWRAHRYTAQSRDARQAIDNASAAIEKLENPSDSLRNNLEQAISAYNAGNFDNAISLANDAERTAEDKLDEQGGLPIGLIAGALVVVLVVVGGGAYYWRQQQQEPSKLQ